MADTVVEIVEQPTRVRVEGGELIVEATQGILRVADALDVDLAGRVDGDVLTWDSATGKYIHDPAAGGGSGDIADAVILDPQTSARNTVAGPGDVIRQIWKAHAAQSVNLAEWQLSNADLAWGLSKDGAEILAVTVAPDEADVPNSQRWQWFEDTVGAPSLRFFQRDSAGTLFRGRALASDYDTGAVRIAVDAAAIDYVLQLDIADRDIITGNGYGPYFTSNGEQIWGIDAWGAMYLSGPFVTLEIAKVAGDSSTKILQLVEQGLTFYGADADTTTLFATDTTVDGIAFFGATPRVAQQTAASVGDLWAALKAYGLLDAGSVAPSVGGAPSGATYITQTPDAGLSAEQALSALATGLVKNTTGTGVFSIAAAGTDYAAASHAHAGEDITSGTVADARIAATIARDSEVAAGYQPLDADLTAIAALADPNADRILFWDDSLGDYTYLTPGTGLTITGATIDAAGGGGGYPRTFKTGLYYLAPSSSTNTDSGVAQTLDRVVYVPFAVGEAVTVDRIGASVTAFAATSVVRLGIYSSTDGQPDARVLDAGTIDAATNGFKEITISQALSANSLYWIAVVPQTAGCTLRAGAVGAGAEWVGTTLLTADIRTANFQEAGVSGALPANATPVTGITQSPMARLRAA